MEIHIGIFFEKLAHLQPTIQLNNEGMAVIKAVKLMGKNQTSFDPDTLYIGETCNLPIEQSSLSHTNLLLVSESSIPDLLFANNSLNIISVMGDCKISVFNEILEMISSYQKLNDDSSRLFKILSEGKDLQEIGRAHV